MDSPVSTLVHPIDRDDLDVGGLTHHILLALLFLAILPSILDLDFTMISTDDV